jgi:hypothetical protein
MMVCKITSKALSSKYLSKALCESKVQNPKSKGKNSARYGSPNSPGAKCGKEQVPIKATKANLPQRTQRSHSQTAPQSNTEIKGNRIIF